MFQRAENNRLSCDFFLRFPPLSLFFPSAPDKHSAFPIHMGKHHNSGPTPSQRGNLHFIKKKSPPAGADDRHQGTHYHGVFPSLQTLGDTHTHTHKHADRMVLHMQSVEPKTLLQIKSDGQLLQMMKVRAVAFYTICPLVNWIYFLLGAK